MARQVAQQLSSLDIDANMDQPSEYTSAYLPPQEHLDTGFQPPREMETPVSTSSTLVPTHWFSSHTSPETVLDATKVAIALPPFEEHLDLPGDQYNLAQQDCWNLRLVSRKSGILPKCPVEGNTTVQY